MLAPDRARHLVREWFEGHDGAIELVERIDPPPDPDSSYDIRYEAVFRPTSLERARVEVWITARGEVALGFETVSRIAARLGHERGSDRFVGGHDPVPIPERGLLAVLELIAGGDIAVAASMLPVLGIVRCRAIARKGTRARLRAVGYTRTDWLHEWPVERFDTSPGLLRYRPWSATP